MTDAPANTPTDEQTVGQLPEQPADEQSDDHDRPGPDQRGRHLMRPEGLRPEPGRQREIGQVERGVLGGRHVLAGEGRGERVDVPLAIGEQDGADVVVEVVTEAHRSLGGGEDPDEPDGEAEQGEQA